MSDPAPSSIRLGDDITRFDVAERPGRDRRSGQEQKCPEYHCAYDHRGLPAQQSPQGYDPE